MTTDAPVVTVAPSLTQLLTRKRIRPIDVARFLAAIKILHEVSGRVPPQFQGAKNLPVPVEVIEIAGKLLGGGANWAALKNTVRKQAAVEKVAVWQAAANEVWARNSDLTNRAVAEKIAPKLAPGRANTIRRKIVKPK